ncbi:hypothetical protein PENTCL1PPCAC_23741, partial [Pristionchus entomophagus]
FQETLPSPPMRHIILIFSLISLVASDESSCTSSCSKTSIPQCGTWLSSERMKEVGGLYELGEGVMNVSCAFSSLPRPSSISWLHRPTSTSSWIPFTCSSKDDNIKCSTTAEQKTSSTCILRTSFLNMTGSYKCESKMDIDDSKASSSEVTISVVGIESVEIMDKSMKPGSTGFVEAKICANPQPEIWWSTGDGLVKPGQTLTNFASSHLAKSMERASPDGPASPLAYCYQVRLIVNNVRKGDSLSLLVRSHDGVSTTRIVSSSHTLYSFLSILLICSSLLL